MKRGHNHNRVTIFARQKLGELMSEIKIKWSAILNSIGMICLMISPIIILSLLIKNLFPKFLTIIQNNIFILLYLSGVSIFLISILLIYWLSKGRLNKWGFNLRAKDLKIKLSVEIGLIFFSIGLISNILSILTHNYKPYYPFPLTFRNIVGMMLYSSIFVGIAEETGFRGLIQTYLMNRLSGSVKLFRWNFHIGCIIAAILFGLLHLVNLMAGSLLNFGHEFVPFVLMQVIFGSIIGLIAGYIYQETKSLAGPVVIHNLIDGLGTLSLFIFYWTM